WMARFGVSFLPRFFTALIGGIVLGIGARWAGGCTSGHGISGTMQLAVSSWIAVILFFIGGIITAQFMYYGLGG
ncbi:MAG: YeeE/YedE thiosulfate transporter family protein, partial [Candidatus Caldatribacteriota bacterium]